MSSSGATPGWYEDPSMPGQLRYFDGSNWTEHVQPASAAPQGASQSSGNEWYSHESNPSESAMHPTAVTPTPAGAAVGGSTVGGMAMGGPGEPPPPEKKSRKGLVVGGVAVLILLLAAGIFVLTRSGDSDNVAAGDEVTTSTVGTTTTTTDDTDDFDDESNVSSTSTPDSQTTTSVTTPADSLTYLADMKVLGDSSYNSFDTGNATVNGETHTRSVLLGTSGYSSGQMAFVEYDLGRKYETLQGTVGLIDTVPSFSKMKVQIYGDGQPLFDKTMSLGQPEQMDIDVSNVLRLRLQITDVREQDGSGDFIVAFADAALTGGPPAPSGESE